MPIPAFTTPIPAFTTPIPAFTMDRSGRSRWTVFRINAAIDEKVLEHVPVKFDIPSRVHKAPAAYDDAEQAALLAAAEALGPE